MQAPICQTVLTVLIVDLHGPPQSETLLSFVHSETTSLHWRTQVEIQSNCIDYADMHATELVIRDRGENIMQYSRKNLKVPLPQIGRAHV